MMNQIPVLRIEIEGVRQAVAHALLTRNDEMNRLIIDSIERELTEEWVIEQIDRCVKSCITKAIEDMTSNWELRQALTGVIAASVAKVVEKASNHD